jgi:hypothetical protein
LAGGCLPFPSPVGRLKLPVRELAGFGPCPPGFASRRPRLAKSRSAPAPFASPSVVPLPQAIGAFASNSAGRRSGFIPQCPPLVTDIIAPLHFADDPMQQAGSNHFVLAKLRRNVLKQGVAVGLRYGFGGLHQPVEFVSGQSQSQLVQWGHGKCSAKNKNAATGLWFSDCISPFRRMHPRARHAVDPAAGAAKAPFSCSRASFWQRPPSPFRA